jgi:hypothetical protein
MQQRKQILSGVSPGTCLIPGSLTNSVEHEADKAMVRCKGQKHLIYKHNMLEVVYDTFPIQEVHGCSQPVPIQRLCESQSSFSAWNARNGNDLFERYYLNRCNNCNYVNVPHEHRSEETAYHDKGPYRSGDESLLFLLIFGNLWLLSIISSQASTLRARFLPLRGHFHSCHPTQVPMRPHLCLRSCSSVHRQTRTNGHSKGFCD